jgi:peptide/nickel transport system substrate-binding protein
MRKVRASMIVAVALLLMGCSPVANQASPSGGPAASGVPITSPAAGGSIEPHGQLTVVVNSLANLGQDYMVVATRPYKPFADEIFDYPVDQDASGKLIPGLATSWTASADGLTWTFVVREGVKFHNGDTLTGEDLAFSWNRLIFDPATKHSLSGNAEIVDSITANGNEVVVKTKSPLATLPMTLARLDGNMGGLVLPKKYFESVGAEAFFRAPVGTGPYKFVSQDGEQSANLTAFVDPARNDWQKARTPQVKDITVMAVPEAATRLALLKSGGADLVPLTISQLEDATASGIRTVKAPASTFSGALCLGYTLNPASPCNDAKVREALSLAIDRDTIAKTVYLGQAAPTKAFFAGPGTFGYPDDLPSPPFDPEKAKALLSEAGFTADKPLSLEIVTYSDDADFPMLPTLAEAMVGYYQNIGINATIKTMEWDAQDEASQKGAFTGQLNNPATSPITLFMRGMDNRWYFPPKQISVYTDHSGAGRGMWNFPEMQQKLEAVGAEFDLAKQETMFADYYRWMAENHVDIPLLAADTVFGVSPKVASWSPIAGKPFVHNLWTLVPTN